MSRRCGAALGVLMVIALPGASRAQGDPLDSVFTRCMTLDTATAWQAVTRRWSTDTGHWTNDSLRHVLIALGDADQATRNAPGFADSVQNPAYVERMNHVDSVNAAALVAIMRRFGWPTRTMVGIAGAKAAFLIAQHNGFMQHDVVRRMQALPPGEVSPTDLAMLEDRVRVSDGLPQRYGTQLSFQGDGPAHFDPIEDVAHLDARRAAAGLPPIAVYRCMMKGYTGREVIDPRSHRP